MKDKPRIAVILDENTSGDASRYEASKGYFRAVRDAGGLPFGIPYLPEIVEVVIEEFDGLLCSGERFAFPDEWYLGGNVSQSPASERCAIEREIVAGYLKHDKPVLGICAGMQTLACINGCRLWSDLQASSPTLQEHDASDIRHSVSLDPGSSLFKLVGVPSLVVNTFHREAIGEVSSSVLVSARADDGIIEAVEIPSQTFALGLQWHQEKLSAIDHPGNAVFQGLVNACYQ